MPFSLADFEHVGSMSVVLFAFVALLFLSFWQLPRQFGAQIKPLIVSLDRLILSEERNRKEVRMLSALILGLNQQLLVHDVTVRGINDAVDGDGAAALRVYEDLLKSWDLIKQKIILDID